tara:strand:+ start:873 stop:1223 length:351 start_codon:yes stop_codon:yes gene_type:complete
MLELLKDGWDLVVTLIVSIWDILGGAVNLVIIDDPFWRGVELTLMALVIWNNRKELIQLIDRIPLLGGLVARGLELTESAAEYLLDKSHGLWYRIRSNTWDKAVNFILKADKDLRG